MKSSVAQRGSSSFEAVCHTGLGVFSVILMLPVVVLTLLPIFVVLLPLEVLAIPFLLSSFSSST